MFSASSPSAPGSVVDLGTNTGNRAQRAPHNNVVIALTTTIVVSECRMGDISGVCNGACNESAGHVEPRKNEQAGLRSALNIAVDLAPKLDI